MKLTLYTKDNCHLCDEMKKIISGLSDEFFFEYEEVDITGDADLYEKFRLKIPVLTIDGKLFAKFRLDIQKLKAKLNTFKK